MNALYRSILAALAVAAMAPSLAHAQSRFVNGMAVTSLEGLTAQDKEMYALATETGRKFTEVLEKWVAAKEVTEDQLMSGLYYPIEKTDPPKFTTGWDKLADRDLQPIEEAAVTRNSTISMVYLVDKNGYVASQIKRFSQPLTGNPAVDLVNNRTKRLLNDRVGMLAARNKQQVIVQYYARDTGEVFATLAVPVYLHGQHFGAVRVTYRPSDAK